MRMMRPTLQRFGDVMGLVTNCEKSQVATIQCDNINLHEILHAFPAAYTTFPMRYLGLPLSITQLSRIHFQYLEDKVAGKLAPWIGKHITMAGRLVLVKAVLTSIAIYFITALDIPHEVL